MPAMNRPAKFKHARLKELRKILGITQTQLAGRICLSPSTVIAVELGTLQMSASFAERVMRATGVDPFSLLGGSELKDLAGNPLNKGSSELIEGTRTVINEIERLLEGDQIGSPVLFYYLRKLANELSLRPS